MTTFRAMTTDVSVVVPFGDEAEEACLTKLAAEIFERSEQTFSRFRPESELSRLNRAEGPFEASPELIQALVRAQQYEELTGGLFNARVGRAMVAAGYDRSFPALKAGRAKTERLTPEPCAEERLGIVGHVVERPNAVSIDLGGMIKGHTVDRVAEMLPAISAVDAGGDMALRGGGFDGDGWIVDIEDPRNAERVLLSFRVKDAAVATSAPNRRTWRMKDGRAHHLIDPRTGAPSTSDLLQVTVVASTTERADVLAKAAYVAGHRAAVALLEAASIGAVLVREDGRVTRVGPLEVTCD